MTTRETRGAALALGVAALAGLASNVARADNNIRLVPGRPILTLKPKNDLAAMNLAATFLGDPEQGTAKIVLMGTCKNLGSQDYKPGFRTVRIERKQGNSWITVEAKTLPALKSGQSFTVVYTPPMNDTNEYRLEVTGPADDNTKNDIFVPAPPSDEVPR